MCMIHKWFPSTDIDTEGLPRDADYQGLGVSGWVL